ncbi:cupin, partial [Staphylococcus pseudintermedius]
MSRLRIFDETRPQTPLVEYASHPDITRELGR